MRLIAMLVIMLSAFFVVSRLQVNENAQLATKSGELLQGRVSRDFVTGQYKVERTDRSTRYVSSEDFAGMTSGGPGIPAYAAVLGFALIVLAGCVGLGVDKAALSHWRTRLSGLRPGITHDTLPPSQREL